MRRETVRKGPEAEEQTRFRIPKLLPGIRLGRGGECVGRDCAISCSLAGKRSSRCKVRNPRGNAHMWLGAGRLKNNEIGLPNETSCCSPTRSRFKGDRMRREGAPCCAQQELSDHRTNVPGNTLRTTPNLNLKRRGKNSMVVKRG